MTEPFEKAGQDAAAFQKLCLDSFSKALQATFAFTPGSAPPEILRDIRTGIFKALAESWDQFLRSPQFLDTMRQWMDNAIAFRKVTDEFLGRARNEMQAPSRNDIDNVLLAVRHMEKRLLDRLDELASELKSHKQDSQPQRPGRQSSSAQNPRAGRATPDRTASSRKRTKAA